MTNQDDTHRPKKEGRSPAYPAVDLETAIERAAQVEKVEHRHFAPVEAITKHWKYKGLSGPALKTVSALIKYGLLETRGKSAKREVKITDFAFKILMAENGSPDKEKAIKEAALRPKIHMTLWNEYGPELPSDDTIRLFLLNKLDFTQSAAREVIQEYRRTITFAKLEESDNLTRYEEDKIPPEEERTMPSTQSAGVAEAATRIVIGDPKPEALGPNQEFNMALSEGKTAYLRIPHSLKWGEWDKIRKLLDVLEPVNDED